MTPSRTFKLKAALILALPVVGLLFFLFTAPKPASRTQAQPTPLVVAAPSDDATSGTQTPPPAAPASEPAASAALDEPVAAPQPSATRPALSLPWTPAPAGPPTPVTDPSGLPPATVLKNVSRTIKLYGSMFGGNPVGSNAEITAALNGQNPKQARFLKAEDGLRTNDKGELIDPWGTPYFFHQLSGTQMEIRSAGPDRIMWTADDLVTK